MARPLKIGWLSNAPHCASGYGTQTRLITQRLKAAGHEPYIFCTHGVEHGIQQYNGIPLLPKGQQFWGQDIVGPYSRQFKTDITVCFLDAWVMEPWRYGPQVRAVTLFPVDHEPLADNIRDVAARFWDRICYSKSAVKAVNEAGLDCHYVPHGIDTKVFHPKDQTESRTVCDVPQNRFVVGVVAANHDPMPCPRKNWKNILEGFALFRARHCEDAILYLHTPLMMTTGVDIRTKVDKLGLRGFVYASDQEKLRLGFPDEWMASLYNSFDVLLAPSMGEWFCLPLVEAQACGTPVITSGWSATEELCFSGLLIDRSEARKVETGDFVYWYEAEAETICEYLNAFYLAQSHWPLMREAAREKALAYDIDAVFEQFWVPTLGTLAGRISEENASIAQSVRAKPDEAYKVVLRDKVVDFVQQNPTDVIIVCPSAGEKCGIAEYAKSAQESLRKAGIDALILPTVESGCVAALSQSVTSLIVLHEYAFFDGMNQRLGRGETTSGILKALHSLKALRPELSVAIQMHTVTEQNGERPLNRYLAHSCRDSGIRLLATTMQGALFLSSHYGADSEMLPLGAWTIADPEGATPEHFSIGNFGMFGAQRDIGAHIELCTATGSGFVGSFYCEFDAQKDALTATLARDGLLGTAHLFADWAEESEVVRRLSLASCLYMPRPEVGNHYAAASVITAMSARRPIIINRAGCYEDLWDVLLVAETQDEAKAIIERLKTDPAYYRAQVDRQDRYLSERDIARVWESAGVA